MPQSGPVEPTREVFLLMDAAIRVTFPMTIDASPLFESIRRGARIWEEALDQRHQNLARAMNRYDKRPHGIEIMEWRLNSGRQINIIA